MKIKFITKHFSELTTSELYHFLRLRNEVFVVEQKCLYQDIDGKDLWAHHVLGYVEESLAAYTRLLAPGISYPEASIGRVIVAEAFRGSGLGIQLMEESVRRCYELFGNLPIRICAQTHLVDFYQSVGFIPVTDSFNHEGIPHTEMLKAAL